MSKAKHSPENVKRLLKTVSSDLLSKPSYASEFLVGQGLVVATPAGKGIHPAKVKAIRLDILRERGVVAPRAGKPKEPRAGKPRAGKNRSRSNPKLTILAPSAKAKIEAMRGLLAVIDELGLPAVQQLLTTLS